MALARLRGQIAAGTAEPIICFEIVSSKNGGRREISLPFSLALELREYIDRERADLLRRIGVSPRDMRLIFVSQKTGKGLTPQSVTNFYKRAANAAAIRFNQPDLATISPHDERHRGITDFAVQLRKAGISPSETMFRTLSYARLARLSTAWIYVQQAQNELQPVRSLKGLKEAAEHELNELVMLERTY